MSDCLKCSYTKGEPKGSRVCRKCDRPENVPKGQWEPEEMGQNYNVPKGQHQPTDRAIANSPPYACPDLDQDYSLDEPLPEVGQARPIDPVTVLPDAGTSATLGAIVPSLPAHSRMGGSAAHRFLNCPGSTALIAGLKLDGPGDDPEWTRHGTIAHALGARCLEEDADAWELVAQFPLPPDQASAVQEYVDVVRSLPGHRRVEVKLHLPELHPLMFSTLDCVIEPRTEEVALIVFDYKHGEGVFVEVERNEQLMYYACMAIMEQPHEYDDADLVKLGICQPRMAWGTEGETTRWWVTSVGELKRWLYDVLLPAMRLEARDMHLQMGEWCRFCPAKLVCPAMSQAFAAFAGDTTELATLSDEVLGRDYALTATIKMRIAAIHNEVLRRRLGGIDVPGTKLVHQKTDRVWKDGVISDVGGSGVRQLVVVFREEAFLPPTYRSPAQIEKLPGGKEFVSEWAYKPEAGYTVALASDRRAAVVPKTAEEKYGDPAKFGIDTGKLV